LGARHCGPHEQGHGPPGRPRHETGEPHGPRHEFLLTDAAGNPASVTDIQWAASPEPATLVQAEDRLSATLHPSAPGSVVVSVTATFGMCAASEILNFLAITPERAKK
jgi:hypothetical protein